MFSSDQPFALPQANSDVNMNHISQRHLQRSLVTAIDDINPQLR